jgi:hypothetical protein
MRDYLAVMDEKEAVGPSWWSSFAMGVGIGMVVLVIVGVVFVVLAGRGLTYEHGINSSVSNAPGS